MKMHEINELSVEEIKQHLEDALEEQSNLRFQKALGQLSNPLRLRMVRHDIARLKTVVCEYELGIRKGPKSVKENA